VKERVSLVFASAAAGADNGLMEARLKKGGGGRFYGTLKEEGEERSLSVTCIYVDRDGVSAIKICSFEVS